MCRFDAVKYSCPRCEVKTCSISCVNRHKQELECDGKKHETGIKELEKFSDNDTSQGNVNILLLIKCLYKLLNDYYFVIFY